MAKKKSVTKLTKREKNLFPFLTLSLEERLRLSGAINLTHSHFIQKDGHYDVIRPLDSEIKAPKRNKI